MTKETRLARARKSSPAIGPNGVLYVGSDSDKLFAFGP